MRIVAAEVTPLALRLRRPLTTARGTIEVRRGFRLRLVDGDGVAGVGEASPAYWIGETSLETTAADLASLRHAVGRGADAAGLRALALTPAAACALDAALVDLAARARALPAWACLGEAAPPPDGANRVRTTAPPPVGAANALPPPAPPLAVCALVAGEDDAAAALAAGFKALKLKVGSARLADDVRAVAAVRARVGSAVALRLDANRAWTRAAAERALAALAPFEPELVEEPLREGGGAALAALAAATPVPLALDESIGGVADLERVVAAGAAPIVVVKAARIGGPTRALELARAAATRGLRVIVTDSLESAAGMRVALHVAAALPPPHAAVGLGGVWLIAERDADAALAPGGAFRASGPGFTVAPAAARAARDDA